jgi:Flp pilus assembly pilin Flp
MLDRFKIPSLVVESGQTLVEYALIIAMVSIASIAALGLVGAKISDVLSTLTNQL